MSLTESIHTRLVNLPHHVPGLAAVDEDGEPMIFLNARHTWEQNLRTYEHELQHIGRDDFYNGLTIIEAESPAIGTDELKPQHNPLRFIRRSRRQPDKAAPFKGISLTISDTLREDAHRHFGITPNDLRWDAILYAMLLTGCQEMQPSKRISRTYYFPPVCVSKSKMYQMEGNTVLKPDEQRRFLYPFNRYI